VRIGVFHPALDMCGGAEVVAVATVNALISSGFDVVLFVNKSIDQKRISEMVGEPLGACKVMVSPIFLKPRGAFHVYENALRSLAFKSQCDLLLDTYSNCIFPWIDVSYMHFPHINNYEFRPGFPYLKTAHIRNILAAPYAMFEKTLENHEGKLLLANSYFTAKVIKESLGAESKVLYPPIPNAFFIDERVKLSSRREDLVVTVARFGAGKGVELVPEIAYKTRKNIKFAMIGLAHDLTIVEAFRRNLKKLNLEDRVTIIPNASREQIKSFLSKAKVYLHTTRMEHFGISIAEAMAMGCLPVVHDSGGAPEFVPDGLRYKNSIEAAKILEKALADWEPEKAERMIENAERFSENNFSKNFIELFTKYTSSIA